MSFALMHSTKRWAALTLFLLALAASGQNVAHAHSPLMMIEDNRNGTITVTGAFSDGDLAAGKTIALKSRATGMVLWRGTLDDNGELTCPKQAEDYSVFFDGGPGHTLEKPGPARQEGEPLVTSTAQVTVKHSVAVESEPVHFPEWTLPLSAGFDAEVMRLIPSTPLAIENDLGLVRQVDLMQCFQRHSQANIGGIAVMVRAKRARGRDVEFSVAPVGLCCGVTSGYLALEYAIDQLYGDEMPQMDDFQIGTTSQMGGVWDVWELFFGKTLDRDRFVESQKSGLTFVARCLSTGEEIRFAFAPEVTKAFKTLGAIRKSPESYPADEMEKVKKTLVTKLLQRRKAGDYGFFRQIENDSHSRQR